MKVGSIEKKRGEESRGNLDEMSMKTHLHTHTQHTWTRVELEEESSLFHAQGRAAEQRDDFLFFFLFCIFSLAPISSCLFPLLFRVFFFCFAFLLSLFFSQCCEFWFFVTNKTSANRGHTVRRVSATAQQQR